MMRKGLILQGTIRKLLTHKEHVVEMVDSIIKETGLDPYSDQTMEELEASDLFDLSRARSSQMTVLCVFSFFFSK